MTYARDDRVVLTEDGEQFEGTVTETFGGAVAVLFDDGDVGVFVNAFDELRPKHEQPRSISSAGISRSPRRPSRPRSSWIPRIHMPFTVWESSIDTRAASRKR